MDKRVAEKKGVDQHFFGGLFPGKEFHHGEVLF